MAPGSNSNIHSLVLDIAHIYIRTGSTAYDIRQRLLKKKTGGLFKIIIGCQTQFPVPKNTFKAQITDYILFPTGLRVSDTDCPISGSGANTSSTNIICRGARSTTIQCELIERIGISGITCFTPAGS